MPNVDATVFLQGLAATAQAAAAIVLCRRGEHQAKDRVLGLGLLAGAWVTMVETLPGGRPALPAAALALVVAALGAFGPRSRSAWRLLLADPWRAAGAAVALACGLHALHGLVPADATFPALSWTVAIGLLWAGWRSLADRATAGSPPLGTAWLLAATGLGQVAAALAGPMGTAVAATTALVAATPLLWQGLAGGDRRLRTTLAAVLAAAVTLALRAQGVVAAGHGEPLAFLAVLFGCFGVAAHLTPAATAVAGPVADTSATIAAGPRALPAATPPPPAPTEPFRPSRRLGADLRTPLTSMVAAAELLGDAGSPHERADHLATIQAEGRRLTAALTDLDDFERLLRGEIEFAADTFDLPTLLRCSIADVGPRAADRGIEVRLDLAADLPTWIQGDPARLRQLVTRLVELSIERCSIGHVTLAASTRDHRLHLVVQSTATGLADDLGQGLGFGFCRQLAMAMGGEVTTRPRPNGGTTVHAELPCPAVEPWEAAIAQQDQERQESPPTPGTASELHGDVLLVDDSRDHQRLLGHLLARTGAHVTTAENGEVALHLLADQAFDLILMDLQMPGCGGLATTRALRARGVTTPVVVLTAEVDGATIEQCLAAGANGHLAKPVERMLLERTVAMYLKPAAAD